MSNSVANSFLPSDETIFERSKLWSNFFSNITGAENYEEIYYEDIPCDAEDSDQSDSDGNENIALNNCGALVKVDNFEGSSSDDFDINDIISETLPIVEERKRRWKESGMDRILDTFDVKAITEKVGAWLKKTRMQNFMAPNSSMEDAHIMHFEENFIQFHSDESVQSADTVKYILSNRKPRAASCTTMTIKRFRYGKRKQEELQRKYNYLNDIDETPNRYKFSSRNVDLHRNLNKPLRQRAKSVSETKLPSMYSPRIHNFQNNRVDSNRHLLKSLAIPKQSLDQKQRSRHKKRRSYTSVKRSISSSSSSSSRFSPKRLRLRPKFRRVSRNKSSKKTIAETMVSDSSSSECDPKQNTLSVVKTRTKFSNAEPHLCPNEIKSSSNLTGFLSENIVNSTAHSNLKLSDETKAKSCQLSPILGKVMPSQRNQNECKSCPEKNLKKVHMIKDQLQMREELTETQGEAKAKSVHETGANNRKVVIYDPENKSLYRESICDGTFTLTKEHLQRSIGHKNAQRFIKFNARKFPWTFDSSSTVYFELPTESEGSHRSGSDSATDEDVLDIFGKQGQIIEQTVKLRIE